MNHGKVQHIGTPWEVYEEPANTFVATFVGSPPMNLVPAGDVLLGFRPEALVPLDGKPDSATYLVFTLDHIREEYLGSEKLVYGEINGVRAVSRLPANHPIRHPEGASAQFMVRRSGIRVFDEASGNAIAQEPPQVAVGGGKADSVPDARRVG
jgi:multiple sugar transport system ATP-binding protein